METLGNKLRRLRGARSQRDAAKLSGISQQQWSKLERNLIPADSTAVLGKIADAFGSSVDALRSTETLRNVIDHRLVEIGKTFQQLAIVAELTEEQLAERLDNGKLGRLDMARIAPALEMQQEELERAAGGNIRLRPVDRSVGLTWNGTAAGDGQDSARYLRLPVMNLDAAAGDGVDVPPQIEVVRFLEVAREWAETQFATRLKHIQVLTAHGDSMVGAGIMDGDLLFVDTDIRQYQGDGFYVFSFRGGLQVKRLRANVLAQRLEIVSMLAQREAVEPISPDEEGRLQISGRVAAWWTLRKH